MAGYTEDDYGYKIENEEEQAVTKEEKDQAIRMSETEMLANLLSESRTGEEDMETTKIEISRRGKKLLEFHIRALTEKEYADAKKKHTIYKKNKQLGTKIAESVNQSKFHAQLIHDATLSKERDTLWYHKPAWDALNVLTPVDFIEEFFSAGETNRILEELDKLSGFSQDEEEMAKN